MPRSRAEWLILPLALLPLAVAAVLCLLARSAYRAQLAPFRAEGRAEAEAWLAALPDGASALRRSFVTDFGATTPPRGYRDVPVDLAGRAGLVRVPEGQLSSDAWHFAARLPTAISAAALGDAQVRLQIESGRAPVDVVGASPEARAFANLLRNPTLAALRGASLPATTKAFIARRYLRVYPAAPDAGNWREAATLLRLVAAAESLDGARAGVALTGAFPIDGGSLYCFGGQRPCLVVPASVPVGARRTYSLERADRPDALLVWSGADEPDGGIAWRGQIDAPLAGQWAVSLPHGELWWDGTLFRRWLPLGAAVLAVLLLAPLSLFVTIRRRARLDEARARFLNEIAHDLRTPLTSLRLYAEMLYEERCDAAVRERYAGVIRRESVRLTGLLANLLDLSRLEGGRRTFEVQDLPITRAVESAVADFEALYPARAADVTVRGDRGLVVRADPTALARCLGNLLDNAGKFTAAGTAISVTWARDGHDAARLTVADDGPGIPASERRSIFDRYSRGTHAQRDGIPGTGLGLSLVRELAEGLGGAVALADAATEWTGAVFEIRLPAAAGTDSEEAAPERPTAAGGARA